MNSNVTDWQVLGIQPTNNKNRIKQAYMEKLSIFHPEEAPEGFLRLREAYETILQVVGRGEGGEEIAESSPVDEWMQRVAECYKDFGKRIKLSTWEMLLKEEVCVQIDLEEEISTRLLIFLMDTFYLPQKVWQLLDQHFDWRRMQDTLKQEFPPNFIDFIVGQIEYEDSLRYELFEIEADKDYDTIIKYYYKLERALNEREQEAAKEILEQIQSLGIVHADITLLEVRYCIQKQELERAKILVETVVNLRPEDVKGWYAFAQVAFVQKNLAVATSYYEKVLKEIPFHAGAKKGLGDCYMGQEKFEEAKECYLDLIREYPYDEYLRGSLYEVNYRLISYYEELHKDQPTDDGLVFKLAGSYFNNYQIKECQQLLIGFTPKEEDLTKYYDLLGRTYSENKDYEQALVYFEKWLEIDDENSDAYEQKGRQLYYLGQYKEALMAYEKGLQITPDDTSILSRKSSLLNKLEKYEEALTVCEFGLKIDKDIAHLHMNKAEALYGLGSYREALDSCHETICRYEYFEDAYLIQMKIYYEVEDYEKVLEIETSVAKLEIQTIDTNLYKAKALNELGNVEEAEQILLKIIEEVPTYEKAYEEIAILKYADGKCEEAIIYFTKQLEIIETSECYVNRALAYARIEEVEKEKQDYLNAIAVNPEEWHAYNKLAYAYKKEKNYEEAIKYFKLALERNDEIEFAYHNLGWCYSELGEYEEAIKTMTLGIEKEPNNYKLYCDRGYVYSCIREREKSIVDYSKALELAPEDAITCNNMGVAYEEKGDYQRAIEYYEKTIELDPEHDDAYRNIADVYALGLKDYNQAIMFYTKQIELTPDEAQLYQLRGDAYRLAGKKISARIDYYKALEMYLESEEETICNYTFIGSCYCRIGKLEVAKEYHEKTIEGAASYLPCYEKECHCAYFGLGEVYEERKLYKEALECYKKAIAIRDKREYRQALQVLLEKLT